MDPGGAPTKGPPRPSKRRNDRPPSRYRNPTAEATRHRAPVANQRGIARPINNPPIHAPITAKAPLRCSALAGRPALHSDRRGMSVRTVRTHGRYTDTAMTSTSARYPRHERRIPLGTRLATCCSPSRGTTIRAVERRLRKRKDCFGRRPDCQQRRAEPDSRPIAASPRRGTSGPKPGGANPLVARGLSAHHNAAGPRIEAPRLLVGQALGKSWATNISLMLRTDSRTRARPARSRIESCGSRPEGKRDRASCRSSAGGRRLCRAHKS